LSMASPGGSTNQTQRVVEEPWFYDPAWGTLTEFTNDGSNPRAALVSVSPDGHHLAYLEPELSAHQGTPSTRLTEEWVQSDDEATPPVRVFALSPPSDGSTPVSGSPVGVEEVHDVAWTPDGRHLLVTVRLVTLAGGYAAAPRSRLLLVDASPEQVDQTVELMTLPADVVAGSYTWAPDGKWVAFLTEATTGSQSSRFVAMCALDTSASGAISGFRYVADLDRVAGSRGPLPVAPVAWSPANDGRLVYAAPTPKITVSNALGLPITTGGDSALFVATPMGSGLSAEEGTRLGSGTGLLAPAWPTAYGIGGANLIAVARSSKGNRPLIIEGVDRADGAPRSLDIALPTTVGGTGPVAARWDLAHGRVLVLARHDNSSSTQLDFWLVQLRAASTPD